MSRVEVFQTWYRSLQDDGSVWCESSSAADVVSLSKGITERFERLTVTKVTGDWERWSPPGSWDSTQPDTPAPTYAVLGHFFERYVWDPLRCGYVDGEGELCGYPMAAHGSDSGLPVDGEERK